MLRKNHTTVRFNTTLVFFLAAMCCLSISCSTKQFPQKEVIPRIEFGNGGGFAGIEYRYVLFEDGRIFHKNQENQFLTLLPSRQTKQLFTNIQAIFDSGVKTNDPGNTYQYIHWQDGDNSRRWLWNSSNRATFDSQLKINYSILMKFIAKKESSDNQ